jgi:curved DNA-binding protein CbpA
LTAQAAPTRPEEHYRVLQVLPTAELDIIEQVYWHLAYRYHNAAPADPSASARLRQLNEAMATVVGLRGPGGSGAPPVAMDKPPPAYRLLAKAVWDVAVEVWWLLLVLGALALGVGLVDHWRGLGDLSPYLEPWRRTMIMGGALTLLGLLVVSFLASLVGATVRSYLADRKRALRPDRDYYAVLHLERFAEPEVVEIAYRHLRQKYIALAPFSYDAEQFLAEVETAYSVLGDPEMRAAYDRMLRQAVSRQDGEGGGRPAGGARRSAPVLAPAAETAGDVGESSIVLAPPGPSLAERLGPLLSALGQGVRAASLATLSSLAIAAAVGLRGLQWLLSVLAALSSRAYGLVTEMAREAGQRSRRAGGSAGPGDVAAPPAGQPAPEVARPLERVRSWKRSAVIEPPATVAEPVGESAGGAGAVEEVRGAFIARLVVVEGPVAGQTFTVPHSTPITIGSDPSCDVVLPKAGEQTIAPQQARIWPRQDKYMFHLLTPEVPATVQGKPFVWVVLEDGDVIEVGPYRLRFDLIPEQG